MGRHVKHCMHEPWADREHACGICFRSKPDGLHHAKSGVKQSEITMQALFIGQSSLAIEISPSYVEYLR